jgi:hypothetical protein
VTYEVVIETHVTEDDNDVDVVFVTAHWRARCECGWTHGPTDTSSEARSAAVDHALDHSEQIIGNGKP